MIDAVRVVTLCTVSLIVSLLVQVCDRDLHDELYYSSKESMTDEEEQEGADSAEQASDSDADDVETWTPSFGSARNMHKLW